MKKGVLLVCLFCISCKKNVENNLKSSLIGKWILKEVYGGIAYRDSIYPANNGTTFTFESGNRYIQTFANPGSPIIQNGTYTLTKTITCYNKEATFIQFSINQQILIVLMSGDTLTLADNLCFSSEPITYKYLRIQ